MNTVIVYSTPYCGYCQAAKNLLNELNIPFEEVDLAADTTLREKLSEKYNWLTVPMIVVGDEFIGGYDDLKKLQSSGELTAKVA